MWPCQMAPGPQGAQGPPGPQGPQGLQSLLLQRANLQAQHPRAGAAARAVHGEVHGDATGLGLLGMRKVAAVELAAELAAELW